MLLRSLQLRRLLSFGPESPPIEFGPLNLIIGPNGSGKSNVLDAIALLQGMPRDLTEVIREGGGAQAWIWKGDRKGPAEIEAKIGFDESQRYIRHRLSFQEDNFRFEVIAEQVDTVSFDLVEPSASRTRGRVYLHAEGPDAPAGDRSESIEPHRSVLGQRRDRRAFLTLAGLTDDYDAIRIFRGWTFGRHAAPRRPQPADLSTDHLLEDASNLALVLNGFRIEGDTHAQVLRSLQQLYPEIVDFHVQVVGGTVQLYIDEGGRKIPASRLSDGTLRWLTLLAVLLDPKPPRLVCIEEPELGLHPDMISELARLLREASARMQLIVTTHSPDLIDAFSDTPESVLVCERPGASTEVSRLDGVVLADWLKRYSLGQLWMKGELGGTRW